MKISVCMATYNGEAYVMQQVDSILPQLGPDDEIVVADDGSTDRTVALLRDHDPRIRIVATTPSGGIVANFERALTGATGDILTFCDQDDVWLPGRIEAIRTALADNQLVLINGEMVDGQLQSMGMTLFGNLGIRKGFARNLVKNTYVGCCMAFRRELAQKALPFPANTPWHDWYIGLLGELDGRVTRIEQPYMLYRRHGGNHSPTGEKSGNSLAKKIGLRLAVIRSVLKATLRGNRKAAGA